MKRQVSLGFCLSAAVIAAATADPVVEFASNSGCFGGGAFTDRSNLDVGPALAVGVALLVLYLLRKAPSFLACSPSLGHVFKLLPLIYALQIATLFAMESLEQLIVHGALLGPAVWLGGPSVVSLTIHALFCVGLTWWLCRSARRLAATAMRVIALIRAIATLVAQNPVSASARRFEERRLTPCARVLRRIGERAPPMLPA